MDLIITLIIILSPTEYYLKDVPIHEPCEVWFEKNVYHDSKHNNHYIGNDVVMGYLCKGLKSGK